MGLIARDSNPQPGNDTHDPYAGDGMDDTPLAECDKQLISEAVSELMGEESCESEIGLQANDILSCIRCAGNGMGDTPLAECDKQLISEAVSELMVEESCQTEIGLQANDILSCIRCAQEATPTGTLIRARKNRQ